MQLRENSKNKTIKKIDTRDDDEKQLRDRSGQHDN